VSRWASDRSSPSSIAPDVRSQQRCDPYRVVLTTITSPGSLGDDAILLGLAEALRQTRPDLTPTLWAPTAELPDWQARIPGVLVEPIGVGLVSDKARDAELLAERLGTGDLLIIPGADVIDGSYDRPQWPKVGAARRHLAAAAHRSGAAVVICNFSIADTAEPGSIDHLRSLRMMGVELWARDSVSAGRLDPTSPPRVVPDAAVLVPFAPQRVVRARVGVNTGDLARPDSTEVIDWTNAFLRRLSIEWGERLSVIGIPHDTRDGCSDVDGLLLLADQLADAGEHVEIDVLRDHTTAQAMKELAATCELIVTRRLHLALQSMSAGVPVVGVEYLGKFAGVFDGYGMEAHLVDIDRNDAIDEAIRFAHDQRSLSRDPTSADQVRRQVVDAVAGLTATSSSDSARSRIVALVDVEVNRRLHAHDGFVFRYHDLLTRLRNIGQVEILELGWPHHAVLYSPTGSARVDGGLALFDLPPATRLARALDVCRLGLGWPRRCERRLVPAVIGRRPDVVVSFGPYRERELTLVAARVPVVHFAEEDLGRLWRRATGTLPGRLFRELEAAVRQWRRLMPSAVVVINQREVAWAQRRYRTTRVVVVPNNYDEAYWHAVPDVRVCSDVFVVSDMAQPRNAEGLEAVLTALDRQLGSCLRLKIVVVSTNRPHAMLETWQHSDWVRFEVNVDDLRPYYAGATVTLVPSFDVTGTKNGVVQGWLTGTPVVAAGPSARSAGDGTGAACASGETPEEVAESLLRVLQDPARQRQLIDAGFEAYERHHSGEVVEQRLRLALDLAMQSAGDKPIPRASLSLSRALPARRDGARALRSLRARLAGSNWRSSSPLRPARGRPAPRSEP
jgi:polysaccharide pyruvyl transferase WcaK-like protein/glycosyltransferase involved in cell wall biosynthesis